MIDTQSALRRACMGKLRRAASSDMAGKGRTDGAARRITAEAAARKRNGPSALEALMKSHDRMNARHLR